MSRELRVLVTCLGFTDRTFLIGELKRLALFDVVVKVYGADLNSRVYAPPGLEKVFGVPPAIDDEFVAAMRNLVTEYEFDLVISGLEPECYQFSKLEDEFPRTKFTVIRDPVLLSKGLVYETLSGYLHENPTSLMSVPEHEMFSLRQTAEIRDFSRGLMERYIRFVSRPIGRFAADGFWLVEDYPHDARWLTQRASRYVGWSTWMDWVEARAETHPEEQILLSTFARKPSYSVDCYSHGGKIRLCAPHRRLGKEWNFVDKAVVEPVSHIRKIAQLLTDVFQFDGPWNFEINEDGGRWALIEINARLSDTATTTNRALGGAYCTAILNDVLGRTIPDIVDFEPYKYTMRPAIFPTE